MSKSKYEPQTMESIALDVQFIWTLGLLAKFLKVTKKQLRKAKEIMDAPEFEDMIIVKKQEVKRTFHFGYQSFHLLIKKKKRHILAPHPLLQNVFRAISEKIIELCPAHEKAYGFVRKRNFQMATQSLVGQKHFFSFDISEAFPSITDKMIEKVLLDLNVPGELVQPLARLVTHRYDGLFRLPQGASSSPAILNMVYKAMCEEIDVVCRAEGIRWCVYADDFTFASEAITPEMKDALLAIPKKFGFRIKKAKTKDNLGKTIPHMLGLTIVNNEVHLRRRTKEEFRRRLYLAWKYNEFNDRKMDGVFAVIKQTYGEVKNWPDSLRKYWVLYINKRKEEKRHAEKKNGRTITR